ncbi:MAG: hypothetical protein Q4Q62_06710 [Thermoplasmata archaeon]|nr:hypothetical protein [Thermoplasmata archaeon]
MSITETLFGLFSGMGDEGVVICIFLLFLIDALLFPTLPELFMVLAYDGHSWEFGLLLLGVAILAELVGVFSLYFIVSKVRVPERISRIANKYVDFLAFSDERIILLNRVAPMIPFLGAFIAMIDRWDRAKCALYIVIGCVVKYGVILLASGFFSTYLGSDISQHVTLVFIFAVIIISFALSIYRKRKEGLE